MIRIVASAAIVLSAALGCSGPPCGRGGCTQSFDLSARCGRAATCSIDGRGYLDNTGIGVAGGQTVRIEMAIERFSGELTLHFDRSLPAAPVVRVDGLTGGANFSSGDRFVQGRVGGSEYGVHREGDRDRDADLLRERRHARGCKSPRRMQLLTG